MRTGITLATAALVLTAGCFYPRFLSPVVLTEGQHAVGIGATAGLGIGRDNLGLAGAQGDLFWRSGFGRGADGGLRAVYSASPPRGPENPARRSLTLIADGRYQVTEDPLAAAGLALAYTRPLTTSENSLVTATGGGTVGTERVYAGLGLILETEIDRYAGLVPRGPTSWPARRWAGGSGSCPRSGSTSTAAGSTTAGWPCTSVLARSTSSA